MTTLTRRQFLKTAGAGLLVLCCDRLVWAAEQPGAAVPGLPDYRTWEDVYRRQWTWDRVGRSTHFVNCWPQIHCSWNVYVKDGIAWREEQAADYPQTRPDVPDFNPRGCNKGACFSHRMYDPTRLKYPLERIGERGAGQWQRVSWDRALDAIADSMLDTITKEGSDRVIYDLGPLYTFGVLTAAHGSLALLLDSTSLDMNTEIGDGCRGYVETFGKLCFDRSSDDFIFSDLILIWGGNPLYTQIPQTHFLTEARYKGAHLVCIAPDYSPSTIHADTWVPVKPGCDAALALAIAHVLIEENLIDRRFVLEQTDLPMLVREDTRRYLRGSDLRESGNQEEVYLHDAKRGVVAAPHRSLDLAGLEPSLEGAFEVTLRDGKKVVVRPVFARLREQLKEYVPEEASKLCGTSPQLIRELAHRFAGAKAAASVTTTMFGKYYHGHLAVRAQALIFALMGHFGKKGSGLAGESFLIQDGVEKFVFSALPELQRNAFLAKLLPDAKALAEQGYTPEMIVYETDRRTRPTGGVGMGASGALFWYVHAGILDASENLQQWDPYLKRPVKEVLDESLKKGWQYVWPRPGNDPRVMISIGSNPLRRLRSSHLALKNLWPKLSTVVTLDSHVTSTTLHSDYVLPVTAWYERAEHKYVTMNTPFVHGGGKVADPYHESKSDWEVLGLLAKAVQRRAKERGLRGFTDRYGNQRRLDDVYDNYTRQGQFGPADEEKVAAATVALSSNLQGVSWDDVKKRGWARFTSLGTSVPSVGSATEIRPDDTITHFTKHVFEKQPYPTVSRRIQFYQDQELYLEMQEELPVHKDPPTAGGNYPLIMSGGHTRWSIHSAWRDHAMMLRQQRGEPVIYVNADDAQARGIADGGRVRVFNDLGEFEVMAKVSPSMRSGMTVIYHAWENYQFKNRRGYQNLIPTPLNAVELAGEQFHLRPMVISMQPAHTDRDTRVEIEAIRHAKAG